MAPLLFTTFHTANHTGYAALAERLCEALIALDCEVEARIRPDLGDWLLNCKQKPVHCLEVLEDFPGHDIVWLDADATIHEWPGIFYHLADKRAWHIAVHRLPRQRHGGGIWREVLGGTIYLRNCPEIHELLRHQAVEDTRNPAEFSQHVLERILPGHRDLQIYDLPASYCFIFDNETQAGMLADEGRASAVIVQHQASREFRKR